jgi:hypothetical protein
MDYLGEIGRRLDMTSAERAEVIREIKTHFDELCDEFRASGMEPAQAHAEAEARMGSVIDIAARLNAAHNCASWKSALLTIVPFALSALYLAAYGFASTSVLRWPPWAPLAMLFGFGAVMLSVSGIQLFHCRRPIWLASWLAAGLACVPGLLHSFGCSANGLAERDASFYSVLLLAVGTLIVSLVTRQLMRCTAVLSAITAVSTVTLMNFNPGPANSVILAGAAACTLAMIVGMAILLVMLAKMIFESHAYGSPTQAVLFLLSALTIRFSPPYLDKVAWVEATAVLCSAAAAFWFTRAPHRRTKVWACYTALLASSLASQPALLKLQTDLPGTLSGLLGSIITAAIGAGIYQIIAAWPMLSTMRREAKENRLTPVR